MADKVPADRIMVWGEHVHTYDYNVYLSKIRQGMDGRWSVIDKYDSNINQKGAYLQMLYLLSGKVGGLFGLTPVLTYHLMVVLAGFFWILTIIFLNKYFLKKPRDFALGTLLSLLASSFPLFFQHGNEIWVDHFMPWWQEMDVLKRLNYLPHYMVNYICLGLFAIFLDRLNTKSEKKILFLICFILFFLFFIHPSGAIIFLFSWIIYNCITLLFFRKYKSGELKSFIYYSILIGLVAAIPLIYLKNVTSTYPWNILAQNERETFISFHLKDYLLALGPILFSGIAGILAVFYFKTQKLLPLVSWFLGSFAAIFVFRFLPFMSPARFIQSANHIPLAILSVYFFSVILKRFKNPLLRLGCFLFFGIIIINGIIHVIFSLKRQTDFIQQRVYASIPLVPYPSQVMYPLKDFANSIVWLGKNTREDEVILSKVTAGNYIPAYAGNFVYLGHFPESPDYHKRENIVISFFQGIMTNQEARKFLKDNSIGYIFYGPQEKENGKIEKYDFLTPVYKTFNVTIFKVVH